MPAAIRTDFHRAPVGFSVLGRKGLPLPLASVNDMLLFVLCSQNDAAEAVLSTSMPETQTISHWVRRVRHCAPKALQ
jgi:hypothetical protein